MQLGKILKKISQKFEAKNLDANLEIQDVALDSRLIEKGKNTIFFALSGRQNDGKKFIANAIANGAKIVVADEFSETPNGEIIFIKTQNLFAFLTEFLRVFYHDLPRNLCAVTGTNGKSSVVEFARQISEILGYKSASIGTLGISCDAKIKNQLSASSLTTPDLVSLYKNLAILKKNGVDAVFIEASSIGLEQNRVAGLEFVVGAFTNFTRDHLDYHGSMAEYFRCKMILFSEILGYAILNSDIAEFGEIKKICAQKNHKIIDYGFAAQALQIKEIEALENGGQKVVLNDNLVFETEISARFQIYNLLCAIGMNQALHDFKLAEILPKIKNITPPNGRMEEVAKIGSARVFIDFAHSPDALENVLVNARKMAPQRLVILFGCGGNRDATKRQLMGEIACRLADFVIVSDDNPRKEDPALIRAEILRACDMTKTIEIDGRKNAIIYALKNLQDGDLLILAGKGHETYQIIGEEKFEFDEREIVREVIAGR